MTDRDLITVLMLFAIAAALIVSVCMELRRGTVGAFQAAVFVLLSLGIAVSTIGTGRDLVRAGVDMGNLADDTERWAVVFSQVATLAVLVICAAIFVSRLALGKSDSRPPAILLIAFVVFYVTNNLIPARFAANPYFSHHMLYPPIVLGAAYVSSPAGLGILAKIAKQGLLAFFVGSAVIALGHPAIVIQPDYLGFIPGVEVRYWGLAPHANAMGPLSASYLIMELCFPSRSRAWHMAGLTVGFGTLVASQSKTAWFAALVCAIVIHVMHAAHDARAGTPGAEPAPRGYLLRWVVFGCIAALAFGIVAINFQELWDRVVESDRGVELLSLTGRLALWGIAHREWMEHPIFGYGLPMWNTEYRAQIGMNFAFHAHNQVLHSAGVAGTVGLVGLIFYFLVLGRLAWIGRHANRGVSLAIFALVLIKSVTEVPLTISGLSNTDLLNHFLLLAILSASAATATQSTVRHPGSKSWGGTDGTRKFQHES